MDRSFEEIRQEALSMDLDSQRALADALESNLSPTSEIDDDTLREVEQRLEAYDRGEMAAVDLDEALARARKLIKH
jgi:hypothetical protein